MEEKKKKRITKKKIKRLIIDMVMLIIGCLISAFSTMGILIPNGLTSGGITGISRFIQNYTPIGFSAAYYAIALIVLVLCLIFLGKKEARKIILMTILYPTILMAVEYSNIQLLEEKDLILAVVYCGVFWGIGNGIVFGRGYSFGGTDTLAKIIQKKLLSQFSQSQILLGIDAVVILLSALIFGRNIALYALITTLIVSKVTEFVMFGFASKTVRVEIISEKYEEISDYILNTINRGVSYSNIIGGYTNEPKRKIISICSPRESVLIKQYVADIDRHAFMSTINVENVWGQGEGFKNITEKN